MDCSTVREALSARIDGEREPVPSARVDEHLETCSECRAWYASATAVTRSLRVGSAVRTPDLSSDILAAVGVEIPRGRRHRALRWILHDHPWRAALVVIATAQLILGAGQAFGHDPMSMGGMDASGMAGHLFNESTAWNVAVAVGFFFAAMQPRAATGLVPVLVAFTVLLTVFVVTDSIAGQVTGSRVASHAIIAVGVLVTIMVERRDRPGRSPSPTTQSVDEDIDLPDGARRGRRRDHLRDSRDPAA